MARALGNGRRPATAAALALLAVALAPAGAHALTTFGADLNRPANAGFDCGAGPGVDAIGGQIFYATNAQTCTWLSSGRNMGQDESFVVPAGGGTVVQVRVRVGPITGPMQVAVLRAVRSALGPVTTTPGGAGVNAACCAEVARSDVFTPAANAISTVAVNLPVKSDVVPNPYSQAYDFDILALNVLAPGVPIPAHDTGNYQDLAGPASGAYFPHIQPGQERADQWGTLGYEVLLQADLEPGQTGSQGGTSGAAVTLAKPVASRLRNRLLLSLHCNQANPCVGAVRVQSQGAAAAARRARAATYAAGEFNIPAGQTKKVKARLTRAGSRQLRKRRRAAMWANISINGATYGAGKLKIKR